MWFTKSKRDDEYRLAIKRASNEGHLIDKWDTELCYVTLGKTLDEFQQDEYAIVCLYKARRGLVCDAKIIRNGRNTIRINDIISKEHNKGYGSKVLESVIKICRQLGVKSIEGDLSETDSDRFDKLEHFYERSGFKVVIDEGRKSGRIVLKL